jgi:PAS domain-containing protein
MRNVLADASTRLFFKDREGRFLLVSSGFVDALAPGQTAQDVIGKTDFDLFDDEHAEVAFADEQEVIATGEAMIAKAERETFADRPDGWAMTAKSPLRDAQGDIIGTCWDGGRRSCVVARCTRRSALSTGTAPSIWSRSAR